MGITVYFERIELALYCGANFWRGHNIAGDGFHNAFTATCSLLFDWGGVHVCLVSRNI